VPTRSHTRLIGWLAAAGGAIALAGCLPGTNDGGHGWSLGKFVYASYVWQPKTVTLVDTTTGETLWVNEVPVGKQVVIQFFKGDGTSGDPRRPDQMAWAVVDVRKGVDDWEGRMDVPGSDWRMLSFDLRPAPEYPREEAPVMEPPALEPGAGDDSEAPQAPGQ
jgi:hypothetical protein